MPALQRQTQQQPPCDLELARNADHRAIFERHAEAVTRRLWQLCGDRELSRDLAQEAFVTAFERLPTYRGDASLATWLHGIAYNHLRDRRKREARRTTARRKLPPAHDAEQTHGPERAAENRQGLHRLQAVLDTLDPDQRDAFVLRVVAQLSLEEAAKILDAPVPTISYRARRAEALVRERFAQENER